MLPIGSIVYLKEGTSKVMILNRGPVIEQDGEELMYDYSACLYPQGLSPEHVFYFNHENVDEVVLKVLLMVMKNGFKSCLKNGRKKTNNKSSRAKLQNR